MSDENRTSTLAVYRSLQRIREHKRQSAHQKVVAAEVERDRSVARIEELQARVESARTSVDQGDVVSIATYHSYRLQQVITERRETARLAQRNRDLEIRRAHHVTCVREELTLDAVVDRMHEREQAAERRSDARQMDEIASRRRYS